MSDGAGVLLLAYHFPPLGGAGVQRSVAFVRRLPGLGFDPQVITGPAPADQPWPPRDPTLAHGLPADLPVHRLAGELDPKAATAFSRLQQRFLMRPGPFARAWIRGCVETGLAVARRSPPRVILASMSPFESAQAAARLARELGVPWVADLRDPWALDEVMVHPSRWHRRVAVRRMGRALASAAAVIANTPEAAWAMRAELPEIDPARIVTIPNGFEAQDFAGDPPSRSGRFRIAHAGHLHTALGLRQRRGRHLRRLLGGMQAPVDLLTRSHVYLLKALERWIARDPAVRADVELILAGAGGAADRDVVARARLDSCVRFVGYLPHGESVALLRSADLLFLPMHRLPPGRRSRIVPGKTYEYMAARRPILAAVPEGDAREFLVASGLGWPVRPDDADAMSRVLAERHAAWRAGEPDPVPDDAFIARFERGRLAAALARVLEDVVAGRVPGATFTASPETDQPSARPSPE